MFENLQMLLVFLHLIFFINSLNGNREELEAFADDYIEKAETQNQLDDVHYDNNEVPKWLKTMWKKLHKEWRVDPDKFYQRKKSPLTVKKEIEANLFQKEIDWQKRYMLYREEQNKKAQKEAGKDYMDDGGLDLDQPAIPETKKGRKSKSKKNKNKKGKGKGKGGSGVSEMKFITCNALCRFLCGGKKC